MKKPEPPSFEATYPAITRWVKDLGNVEFGYDQDTGTFVRATDESGVRFGGGDRFGTIDDALRDLEEGITAILEDRGRDKTPATHRSSVRRKATRRTPRSQETPASRKVRKLGEIAEAVRQGEHPSVTRLTVVKTLCEDPKDAGAFALFLARGVQRRMREKNAPKRYRELVDRSVRAMKLFLDEPGEGHREQLWSLFQEVEEEQNEYENIRWGVVRNVKSFDLLVVEHALQALLRPHEAPFWLYYAARDYTGRTNVLPPSSSPVVEEIAGFWRKHVKVKD